MNDADAKLASMTIDEQKRLARWQTYELHALGQTNCPCGLVVSSQQRGRPQAVQCPYCGLHFCGRCATDHISAAIRIGEKRLIPMPAAWPEPIAGDRKESRWPE